MDMENEYRNCKSAALLIHAALFAYQKAYGRMVGTASGAIFRFAIPYLTEMIDSVGLPQISKEKSIEDNMSIYISMVKGSGYVIDAVLKQESEEEYAFEMHQCSFAFRVHKIFNDGGLVCPFAILAAAIIYLKTEAPISIEDSDFSDTGSKTRIIVQRLNR